jgi:ubiquinone/menaquinone biosynthesis C-methylase UbiE
LLPDNITLIINKGKNLGENFLLDTESESPSSTVFEQISKYWSEMADAHKTEKQVEFVKRHLKAKSYILDLASGNGRHSIRISEGGCKIVALDISKSLLKIAKSNVGEDHAKLLLVNADMRFLPFRSEIFDAIISMDTSFGYLTSQNEDLLSLKEIKRVVSRKGILLIDVFNAEYMIKRYYKGVRLVFWRNLFVFLKRAPIFSGLFKWIEYPSFYFWQKRKIESNRGRMILKDLWIFRNKESGKIEIAQHLVRLYTYSQWQKLLSGVGLQILEVQGNYGDKKYDESSNIEIIVTN